MTNDTQIVELPRSIATYLATPKDQVGGILEQLFTADAVVHDEGQTRIGIDAIHRWSDKTAAAFSFIRTITSTTIRPHAAIVGVLLEGNFPGSPVELHHHFSVASERIAAMTICP